MRTIEIIAECGINHGGNMQLAKTMIHVAKYCGADTAKFQVYDPKVILDPEHPDLAPWWDLILKTELGYGDAWQLARECQQTGIRFLASVFEPNKVRWLRAIIVERYKIAARSVYNEPLLREIAETGKPVVASYSRQYLREHLPPIEACGIQHVDRLYCVSEYPTPLRHFRTNSAMFRGGYAGVSDHTIGITAAVAAMAQGARIVEKHFTLDRSMPGPDQVCSIEPDELKRLCEIRDEMEVLRGD